MVSSRFATLLSVVLAGVKLASAAVSLDNDPCAKIGNQTWAAPADVRACLSSFQVDPEVKSNIIDVITKTLAFHTSVNYQKLAPEPFSGDVHEDILADLARIGQQDYANDLELHIDLSQTLKRLNDGHCAYINKCYDSLFLSYLPIPVVLLTDAAGSQAVHIAPEAFIVSSAEFGDEIDVWQNALPDVLKGKLSSLSGAKVLAINGEDPFLAVNNTAAIIGGYQSLGARQNGFFASYNAAVTGWIYNMGRFAQQPLPLSDSVTLTIQLPDSTEQYTITLPYRSRIGATTVPFTDSASLRANNCVAVPGTNGVDAYSEAWSSQQETPTPDDVFRQVQMPSASRRRPAFNAILDDTVRTNVLLPSELAPINETNGDVEVPTPTMRFYMLDDGKTGAMALGTFIADDENAIRDNMLTGLQTLKANGATQLVVDVTNNGGGLICAALWLHRIIAGPKDTTVPQPGLDSQARAGPLARRITKQHAENPDLDPDLVLAYNPLHWRFANGTAVVAGQDWLDPVVEKTINGVADAFSQPLGVELECDAYFVDPPAEALFDPKKVAIVSNARCASSCSLFSITMQKKEGATTVVVGGKADVQQHYAGVVGGQSLGFADIDTEIKSAHLKDDPLAPPDFLINGIQGITWRLAFGIDNPEEPEEWQSRPADVLLPLTADIVNNPRAIWERVAQTVFSS